MKFTRLLENKTNVIEICPKDIKEITLLSMKEAKKLPPSILFIGQFWWLRDPSYKSDLAGFVSFPAAGPFDLADFSVKSDNIGVRPALRIFGIKSLNLKLGDIVKCFG